MLHGEPAGWWRLPAAIGHPLGTKTFMDFLSWSSLCSYWDRKHHPLIIDDKSKAQRQRVTGCRCAVEEGQVGSDSAQHSLETLNRRSMGER